MDTNEKFLEEIMEEEWSHYELLMDYPNVKKDLYQNAEYEFEMGKQEINAFCLENEIAGELLFCSLVQGTLATLAYQNDIVMGVMDDTQSGTDNIFFVRCKIDRTKNVLEYIKSIESQMDLFRKDKSFVDKILRGMSNKEEILYSDFDVIFHYTRENKKTDEVKESGYGLKITVYEEEAVYRISISYAIDLYENATSKRIGTYLKNIVKRAIDNTDSCVAELFVPSENEIALLEKWNSTSINHKYTTCSFCGILNEQVVRIPNKTALIYDDKKVTFKEFAYMVDALASHLAEIGVGKGDYVAIYAERSIEMIVAIYAVMRVKAIYVPLSPSYEKSRIEYILNDCVPKAILTYHTILDSVIPIINLDSYDYEMKKVSLPDYLIEQEDGIYCIYTSGTTGNPKGVKNTISGLLNVIQWMQKEFSLIDSDVILQKTTYVFDVSASEILWFCLAGVTLVLAKPGDEKDPEKLIELISKEKVTVIDFVPSMLSAFLQVVELKDENKDKIKSLRYVFAAGEALKIETARKLYTLTEYNGKHAILANIYGPTEASIYSSFYVFENGRDMVPIGKPVDNCQLYIRRDKCLCGIGVPGELCIAGKGVAQGYINKPELTEKVFQKNPYGEGQIYYSGDLVRWMPDGNIEYLGRMDSQVKVRGYRIELGEIESAFHKIEGIKDAVVILKEDGDGDKMLCAYYVADNAWPLTTIRKELANHLAPYMMPAYITFVSEIPVTANGKLNRKKLAEMTDEQDNSDDLICQTEEEKIVCEVLAHVLNQKQISIEDSFIGLGGDSIKAIKVMSKFRERGYDTTLANIIEKDSIKELALSLKMVDVLNYEQGECFGVVKPTPIIQTFMNWDIPKREHYNQSILLPIDEDPDDINDVLNALYENHDCLRGIFCDEQFKILSINESNPIELEVVELDSIEDNLDEFENIKAETNESFCLEEGPLFKAVYFMSEKKSFLFLCAHHLVIDGVSWRILLEDFWNGLNLLKQGKDIVFPKKTMSYIHWAETLQTYSESDSLKSEKMYWDTVNQKIERGRLAFVRESNKRQNKEKQFEFSPELTDSLLYRSNYAYGTHVNDLLIASLGLAIKRISGQEYVSIGLEGHGREEITTNVKTDRTVGWFTSMYPLTVKNRDTIEDQIIENKDRIHGIPKNGIGYGLLYPGKLLDVDICFNYLGIVDSELEKDEAVSILDGIDVDIHNQLPGAITINGEIRKGVLRFIISWDENAVSEEVISRMIKNYQEALNEVVDYCCAQKERTKTKTDFTTLKLHRSELQNIRNKYPNVDEILPLLPLQEAVLYHCMRHPDTKSYQIQAGFLLAGKLEIAALKCAVKEMVYCHPALRTVFTHGESGETYQIILNDMQVPFESLDYSGLNEATQQELLEKKLSEDKTQRFDIEHGALIRLKCIKMLENEHMFIISFHHLSMDGWSIGNFMSELKRRYQNINKQGIDFSERNVNSLETRMPDVISYYNYISKSKEENDISYWDDVLEGFDGGTKIAPLPNSTMEKDEAVYSTGKVYDCDTTAKIAAKLSRHNITFSNFAEAAWGILLAKYNWTKDVLFGKVISGRNVPVDHIGSCIGMYVRAIPVRIHFSRKESVWSLIKSVQMQSNNSIVHSSVSLSEILRRQNLNTNLLNTLYVFESDISDSHTEEECFVYSRQFIYERTEYDLTLRVGVYNNQFTVELLYNSLMYSAYEAELILQNYCSVLEQCINEKDITFGKIALKGLDIVDEMRQDLKKQEFICDENNTIVNQFYDFVQKKPNLTAVVFGEKKLSYAEFNHKANQVAAELVNKGIGPNDFVVILAKRSIEMVLAVYGVLKAGAAYVPVDIGYPMERVNYILDDCKPKAILAYQANIEIDTDIPIIDLADEKIFTKEAEEICGKNKGTDYIYCIYTSGTTGHPKGVVNKHKGLINLINWMQKMYPLEEGDRILQKTTYVFDVSASELLWWSTVGATLVIPDANVEKDALAILDIIYNEDIDMVDFVPSMLNVFLGIVGRDSKFVHKLKPLKYVISAGEALSPEVVNKFYRLTEENDCHILLANLYGPTEASIYSTYYNCVPNMETVPIGKPLGNVDIYIMQDNIPCGIGVPGELCISGVGVAEGYLNLESVTEKKFVESPFGEGKMYRSGDLAFWNSDGNIEYLGRIDTQVKIRGFRIELGEIENALRKIKGIRNCAVIARKDNLNENALYAYVASDDQLDISLVKKSLKEYLPSYMVPNYIMQIDQIPVTLNGKLNRRLLPKIHMQGNKNYVAPRNDIEKQLCGFYEEILGVKNVSVTDDFFDLGGHSLKATRLMNRIHSELCGELTLNMIFKNPVIEDLAAKIELFGKATRENIGTAEVKDYYQMSSAQKRIYLFTKIDPDNITYNIPQCFKISGNLDVEKLRVSLEKVVKRHEILRTNFTQIDEQLVQIIHETIRLDFVTTIDKDSSEEALFNDFVRSFDLENDVLFRIKIVQRNDYYILLFDIHHIIADGVSLALFWDEVSDFYNGKETEEVLRQYKDFSESENNMNFQKEEAYWLKVFEDIPVINLPTDYPRPMMQRFQGDLIRWELSDSTTNQVEYLMKQTGLTEYMLYLALVSILLGKYSREENITIGSSISGRMHNDTEKMLGDFVNTLVMRTNPAGNKNCMDYMQEVKKICIDAYEHQDYPYEKLVEKLDIVRDFSRNPLFDVFLSVQNYEEQKLELMDVDCVQLPRKTSVSKFDLTFNVFQKEEKKFLEIEYDTDLFDQDNISWIGEHLLYLISQIAENISASINDLVLVTPKEKNLIIENFVGEEKPYDKKNSIVDIFYGYVENNPNQIALKYGEKFLTYSQTAQKAQALAGKLSAAGIGTNDCVVLHIRKGIERFLGILGVLSAGAVYVAVDPDWPQKRIEFVLQDCNPKAVITLGDKLETDLLTFDLEDLDKWSIPEVAVRPYVSQDDMAYIIYTSGTTGTPKGVMICHRGLMALRAYFEDTYEVSKDDHVLQFANYVFDASVWEWVMALGNGAALVIVPEEVILDEEAFSVFMRKEEISITLLPPQYYLNIPLDGIRVLSTGGSAASSEVVEKALNNNRYLNVYGPTEGTVVATGWEYKGGAIPRNVPIGKPNSNTKAYILNGLKLCGIGEPGELCLAGDSIAKGYMNLPEMTQEKFIKNPYGKGMMYRSGDLAKWSPDGNIIFMGRIDTQVKIRGFRIELGEIETAFRALDEITDVAVTVVKEEAGDKIISYVVSKEKNLNAENVRNMLRGSLPEYMLPSYVVQVEKIPTNSSGKVDTRALLKYKPKEETTYFAPQTEVEKLICEIFKEVLGKKQVGRYDSFYELGGDSIKAIRIISKLRNYGYSVTNRDILMNYTPYAIAAVTKKLKKIYSQDEVSGIVPLTPVFKEFFNWNFLKKEHFNQSVLMPVEHVTEEMVKETLTSIVNHYDMLRLVYKDNQLEILSKSESRGYDFYVCNLVECDDVWKAIEEKCNEQQSSIDLENGPIVKSILFKSKEKDYLFLCIHHFAVDGVSWRILVNDLNSAFESLKNHNEIKLTEKTASFIEWAEKLNEFSQSRIVQKEKDFWMKVVNSGNHSEIPFISDNPKFMEVNISFDEEETDLVLHNCHDTFDTKPQELFLTALVKTLHEQLNMEDITVFLEGHGREIIEEDMSIENTIGWFTSIYPVYFTYYSNTAQAVTEMKELLNKIPNGGIGYGLLKDQLPSIKSQIYFNYLGEVDTENEMVMGIGKNIADENHMPYLLSLNGFTSKKKLFYTITVDKNWMREQDIERFSKMYRENLIDLARYCACKDNISNQPISLEGFELAQDDLDAILGMLQEED